MTSTASSSARCSENTINLKTIIGKPRWFNSLGIKSVVIVIAIVVISTSLLSYFTISKQNALLASHLEEKVMSLGHYIALVIPEDILAYDYESLNNYMREVSQEKDIVYGVVIATNNQNITSFLPVDDPYINKALKKSPNAGILDVINAVKQNPDILHREFPVNFNNQQRATLQLGVTRQHVNEISSATLTAQFMYAAVIILLLSCAVYLVLVSQVLRPVNKLMSAFKELGDGEVHNEISIQANNEFRSLSTSYNSMVSKLKYSLDELVDARDEAEKANQAKSDFLSRMSHELRTPMNAILGFSQLLTLEDLTKDQKEFVRHILFAGNHLLDLINEILDIHLIEQGQVRLNLSEASLNDILDECCTMLLDLAAERDVKLVKAYEAVQPAPAILIDKQRLRQVIINLLSNAIKYNNIHGSVSINYAVVNDKIQLHVIDNGIGIAKDELKKIFQPFERSTHIIREIDGIGIGLALCKDLIERMDGTISVTSTPGAGSDFMVELPLASQPDQKEPVALNDSALISPSRTHKVLYIEDNPMNHKLLGHVFERWPDIVLGRANTGKEGIDKAISSVPDLILLDMQLPDINGDEIFVQLRHNNITRHIPVVIISANVMPEMINSMRAAGIIDYLEKPVDIDKLIDIVENIIDPKSA